MKETLKILLLFKKPGWEDYRLPYIIMGIFAWLEIILMVMSLLGLI
jgi:hypothetical protein